MDKGIPVVKGGLRQRKGTRDAGDSSIPVKNGDNNSAAFIKDEAFIEKGSYWLTRIILLRYIAFIYGNYDRMNINNCYRLIGKCV